MALAKDQIRLELERVEEDCVHSGKAHFNAAERWTRFHYMLGLPAIVLSALAGTALFSGRTIAGGLMSSAVAVLTAMQTFLKPSERASAHKSSGDQYLAVRNDARVFRQVRLDHACDDQAAIDGLDEFTKRRRELNLASPQFANADFKKAKAGIDAGEAAHRVDR